MSPAQAYPMPFAGYSTRIRSAVARVSPLHRLLLGLLAINVMLGAYVITEPAPYDIGILVVFAAAICTQGIAISRQVLVAGSLLLLFLVTGSILTSAPMDWDRWLHHSGATLVLSISWLLYAGVTYRFGASAANRILKAYTIAGFLGAVAALVGYYDMVPNLREIVVFGNRARSFFKDPNVFGPFLLAPTLTCVMLIQNRSTTLLKRIPIGVAGVLMVTSIFLTYSRAAYATMLFALAAYLIFTGVLRSWKSFVWLVLIVGCASFLISLLPAVTQFMEMRLEMHRYDQDRFEIFQQAVGLGTSNLLGVGTGQSHHILGYGVHSMYLRLFADHGAVGLIAFLVFVGACVSRMVAQLRKSSTLETRRLAALVLAATLGTLINGLVIETIHWRHLWLLLALCWYSFPEPIPTLNTAKGSLRAWPTK